MGFEQRAFSCYLIPIEESETNSVFNTVSEWIVHKPLYILLTKWIGYSILIFIYFDGFPKKILFESHSYSIGEKKHLHIPFMLPK